ncbi:MAG: N-6 DNA methylase, partial [candidate division WOR-3 bacterium]
MIPADVLELVAKGEATGQRPQDFGLAKSRRLSDEIASSWQDARTYWAALQRSLNRLPKDDPATTVTREVWVTRLLESLGYDQLTYMPAAAVVNGQSFAISHRAGSGEDNPPVHIVGFRADLDKRAVERPRLSPQALVQQYLNLTEHLWGITTNGRHLRLLRDASRMSRPSYVDFDLEQMMTAEKFADFALFYRLLHRSRLPRTMADAPQCLLETYYQQGIEQGSRVREHLRDNVEAALRTIGQGLLENAANNELCERIRSGSLSAEEYYRQLLRLIYRLLFLMVTEERGLLAGTIPLSASERRDCPQSADIYHRFYSITRLRELAANRFNVTHRHHDLWQGLFQTFALFADNRKGEKLGLSPLNGDLFGPHAIPDLEGTELGNGTFVQALYALSFYSDKGTVRRINYSALDVEELGSVYESLLDLQPVFTHPDGRPAFQLTQGTERKTTGSYYTPPELVEELVKSALVPVIEDRLKSARTPNERERAILEIAVCDPACGSGHFLLAAARRLARELAQVRSGEDEPSPREYRLALRDVITHCVYGV